MYVLYCVRNVIIEENKVISIEQALLRNVTVRKTILGHLRSISRSKILQTLKYLQQIYNCNTHNKRQYSVVSGGIKHIANEKLTS